MMYSMSSFKLICIFFPPFQFFTKIKNEQKIRYLNYEFKRDHGILVENIIT